MSRLFGFIGTVGISLKADLQVKDQVTGQVTVQDHVDFHRCFVWLVLLAQWSSAALFQGKQTYK
ncbi:hypothetical protein V6259_02480 [Marinomonas sp. TI.3.20]|uniref:hypothetical protein n=1 Tax=Marinomonas sp. TI.3.20 TaxID=3121296 RepID=UPI0031203ABF